MSDLPQFPLPDADPPRAPMSSAPVSSSPPPPLPPPPRAVAPPKPRAGTATPKPTLLAAVGAAIGVGVVLLIVAVIVVKRWRTPLNEDAIVRVVTGDGRGTGFFVQPPSGAEGAYVVTAYHVVASGEPVTIERRLQMSEHNVFVEAYPETELAAFDVDADLAILHVKNVPARRFETLKLAETPIKNEAVVSAGFPPNGTANRADLSTRAGHIDQLVRFDAIDSMTGKVAAANKVDGLLLDSSLERGFSGGPTCNSSGEVVGVNVLKDTLHRGQDGAVSVAVLRDLLKQIKRYAPPTAADAEALFKKIQEQYLMLPVDDRAGAPIAEYVANAELPQLRALLREMRSLEGDHRARTVAKDLRLASHAMLGILVARLPGKALETYQASSTHDRVAGCEDHARGIERFLGGVAAGPQASASPIAEPALGVDALRPDDCLAFAMRPLAWDLTASTLEWEGAVREYKVVKMDEVDAEGRLFRASVRIGNGPSLLPVHVTWEAGGLRLKLFDKTGSLYALEGARSETARDFEGAWTVAHPRRPDPGTDGVETERSERITVTVTGTDTVDVVHQSTAVRFATKGAFRCNADKTVTTKATEQLSGHLYNGIVTGGAEKLEYLADGCASCKLCVPLDRLFVLKRYGDRLLFYGTDGSGPTEAIELTRE